MLKNNFMLKSPAQNALLSKGLKKLFFYGLLLCLALCMTLFLCSCQSNGGQYKDANYHQGTKGLLLTFLQQSPPSELYEQSTFTVSLALENRGAVDVMDTNYGILSISFDPFYIDASGIQKSERVDVTSNSIHITGIQLSGKSVYHPTGSETFLTIPNFKVNAIKGQREQPSTKLFTSLCYPYTTVFAGLVCVDMSSYGENLRNQVCSQKDLTLSDQGAPIAITRVEVDNQPAGNDVIRPVYVIHIKNKGTGSVLSPALASTDFDRVCLFTDLNREDFNTVQVKAFLSESKQLECNPSPVKLIQGEGFTRCQVSDQDLVLGHQNYEAPLSVNLSYIYLESNSKEIKIKRLNVYGNLTTSATGCLPFEVQYDDKCISKCDYCAMNKGGSFCQPSTGPTVNYALGGFACQCSKDKCSGLSEGGLCAYTTEPESALCPGNSYCCQVQCSSSQVMIDNKCYDKCSSSKCYKITKQCACGTGTDASKYKLAAENTFCCPLTGDSFSDGDSCNTACTTSTTSTTSPTSPTSSS